MTLSFRVCLGPTTSHFCYQLRDNLLKDQLWTAAEQRLHTDVEFIVQKTRRMAAHRCVVAVRSPVLAALCGAIEVYVDDVPADVFQHVLYFLYTGELPDTAACDHQGLWRAADKYQIDTLKELCGNGEFVHLPTDLFSFMKAIPLQQTCTRKR